MDVPTVRSAARSLGLATVAFGALPLAAPGLAARVFGLPTSANPAIASVYRSIGVRDLAIGLGLWSAATHGGNYAPWLLARAICDGGDFLGTALAIRAGVREKRFLALNLLALGATLAGAYLHRQARSAPQTTA
jgi:hypothetical protein